MESEILKEREKTDTDSLISSQTSSSDELFDTSIAAGATGAMVLFHFVGSMLSVGVLTGGIGLALIGFLVAVFTSKQSVVEATSAGFASAGIITVLSLITLIFTIGLFGGWMGLTFLIVGPIAALGGSLLGEFVKSKV